MNIPETDYEELVDIIPSDARVFELTPTQLARFWAKTDVDAKGCKVWRGAKKGAYGFVVVKGVGYRAHRLSLMLSLKRPLLPGKMALHRPGICHNTLCVNPEHLYEGTGAENNADMTIDGTAARGTRHGMAKLGEADVWAIRDATEPVAALAARHGVTATTIRAIRTNRIWKHLVRPSNVDYGI
jgi:hypothetical protein